MLDTSIYLKLSFPHDYPPRPIDFVYLSVTQIDVVDTVIA